MITSLDGNVVSHEVNRSCRFNFDASGSESFFLKDSSSESKRSSSNDKSRTGRLSWLCCVLLLMERSRHFPSPETRCFRPLEKLASERDGRVSAGRLARLGGAAGAAPPLHRSRELQVFNSSLAAEFYYTFSICH